MISFGFLATNLTLDYGSENVTLFLYNTVTKIDFYIKIISAQKWDFEKDFSCIICMAIIKSPTPRNVPAHNYLHTTSQTNL